MSLAASMVHCPHLDFKELSICPLGLATMKLEWKAAFLRTETVPAYQQEFMKLMALRRII